MATQNNSLVIISDLTDNKELSKAGQEFGATFNTALNAAVKSSNTMTTITKALINTAAGNPQNFAHLAQAFATKISRANWNSAATFFRTTAKKEGYTVSMTCDRDSDNKRANLIKASFEKTPVVSDEQKAANKKTADKDATKAAKQAEKDLISEYQASHGDDIQYPTTQVAILELLEKLLADSSQATQQKLFAMVGTSLENAAKAPTVDQELENELANVA